MSVREYIRRYAVLIVSLALAAASVALVVHAGLGNSPVSGVNYVLYTAFPVLSFGSYVIFSNLALLLGQILMLRRDFKLVQLLQIPVSLLLGGFTDLMVWLAGFIPVPNYPSRMAVLLAGCVVAAVSVSLAVQADVLMNSGEAFVKALSVTVRKKYGSCKVAFDVFLVVLIALLSVTLLGHIEGLREGTVIYALLVGNLVKLILPRLGWLERWMREGWACVRVQKNG